MAIFHQDETSNGDVLVWKNCWWKKSDQPGDMNKYHSVWSEFRTYIYIYTWIIQYIMISVAGLLWLVYGVPKNCLWIQVYPMSLRHDYHRRLGQGLSDSLTLSPFGMRLLMADININYWLHYWYIGTSHHFRLFLEDDARCLQFIFCWPWHLRSMVPGPPMFYFLKQLTHYMVVTMYFYVL